MNELTEQAKDGTSVGSFDASLTSLIGNIPNDSPTMTKDEEGDDPLNGGEEGNETPTDPKPKGDAKPEGTKEDDGGDPLEEDDEEEDSEDENGEEGDDEPNLIDELASEFGDVDFGDQTEFESEGQAAKVYIKKLLETKSKDIGKKAIDGLLKQMPEVAALVNHLSQGYGLESFLKETQPETYTPIDLEDADDTQKEAIIRQAWKLKGLEDDVIDDALETARDSGKLDARAATAQEYLKKKHEDEVEKVKKSEAEAAKAQEAKNKEIEEKLHGYLESGKLLDGTVTLDKEKTKVLKNFVFGEDAEGNSIRMKAWAELPLDKQLLLDFLVASDFKDLKFSGDPIKSKISRNIKIKNKGGTRVKIDNPSKESGAGGDAPFNVKSFFNNVNN